MIDRFKISNLYTHEEVFQTLSVGNAGGIRVALDISKKVRRIVLMTAEASEKCIRENPYHDRVEGDILVYTATGRQGEQLISGVNRRLIDHWANNCPIYGFSNVGSRRNKSLGKRRWKFLGLLQPLRHYTERQLDSDLKERQALMFEFLIHRNCEFVDPSQDWSDYKDLLERNPLVESQAEADVVIPDGLFADKNENEETFELESIRHTLLAMPPRDFEFLVRDTLIATGFSDVMVTPYSGDGGIDVSATASDLIWPYRGCQVQLQVKRWLHSVGRREVAELRGSLQPHAHGAVVTTSFFTRAAISEGADNLKKPIGLINGFEFAAILKRNRTF
ncbi:MAG: restriction endonuclease [Verrucomicrobiae bacterium]|nr:restriction endonuclease [Verrucomicrobiae bacterium]